MPELIAVIQCRWTSNSDGTIATYNWIQTSGQGVTITNASQQIASFTAPVVATPTVLSFELTVTDNDGDSATDAVDITVNPLNQPPLANAGNGATVNANDLVSLDGSSSSDSGGTIVSYGWAQTSGTVVTLTNPTQATASFTAPVVASSSVLGFELTVTDDDGDSTTDQVDITVNDGVAPTTTFSSSSYKVKGKDNFDITLTSDESGATHFRRTGQGSIKSGGVDDTSWQVYSGIVHVEIPKNGQATFEYYSVDATGNTEATQTEILQ